MMKVGRNDPCLCGSGKKYKKCCLSLESVSEQNNSPEIGTFTHKIVDWVIKNHKNNFSNFLEEHKWKEKTKTEVDVSLALDAFIFDYALASGLTPFETFFQRKGLGDDGKKIYQGYKDNIFSIFEVLDIVSDESLKIKDLTNQREYLVKEKRGTHQVREGCVIFCRLVNFNENWFVISPAIKSLPPETLLGFKLHFSEGKSDKLTALDVLKVFDEEPKTFEQIKNDFKKKLEKMGIKIDFRTLESRINDHTNLQGAFPEIFEFNFPSNQDFAEVFELLQALWNKHPRKEFEGKSPEEVGCGPTEQALIVEMSRDLHNKIDPNNYESEKGLLTELKRLQGEWLNRQQAILNNKTPLQIILNERKALDNPNKTVSYTPMIIQKEDYDLNKAEKIYMEAVEAQKTGAIGKSLELFKQVAEMYPENYKAWGNLGLALAFHGDKKQAIRCFEKALEIEPNYDIAKKNLEFVKSNDPKRLALYGITGTLEALLYDAELKKKGLKWRERDKELAKIDVWDRLRDRLNKKRQ